jgi:hypothetical protein
VIIRQEVTLVNRFCLWPRLTSPLQARA